MRPLYIVLLLMLASPLLILAQTIAPPQAEVPPQTARQALLEMFTSKTPGAFEKHLPEAARHALRKGEDAATSPVLREFSEFRTGIALTGEQLQTYDSGPLLLTLDEKVQQRKFEVMVERDDLAGDEDEIEVSFQSYKDGEPEALPVRPRVTFAMKEEKRIWRLNEVTVALHLPLADPAYLKDLQKTQNQASESSAVGNLRTLVTAELMYYSNYPERGYTCKISDLGGTETPPGPHHASVIDQELASGKKDGYIFSIRGCDVPPSSKYLISATPADSDSGMRTFCTSESGVVRYVVEGNAETCLSEGAPLQ